MSANRVCGYGNCAVEPDMKMQGVSVNFRSEERPTFCCGEHAALWLLRREGQLHAANRVEEMLDVDRQADNVVKKG